MTIIKEHNTIKIKTSLIIFNRALVGLQNVTEIIT